MGTQLILTVGTNPLPVWVAWYHLKEKLPKPIKVRLVYTKNTVDERDRLRKYCQGADFLDPIQTSAGRPGTVRRDIDVILNDLDGINIHVHYTGGTKVMAVETVAGIEYGLLEGTDLDTSYLDPRYDSGPAIVNSRDRILVGDTRKGICPDLKRIAILNGFELGPFRHRWGRDSNDYEDHPAAEEPQDEQLRYGEAWLDQGWPPQDEPRILEYGACAAFKQTLNDICLQKLDRSNYKIFRSVFVRRQGASDWDKNFELDVVAVLGHQIVVVSCTVDRNQEMIKKKGMEAILRARQLGGDEARAIVLCSAVKNVTDNIQRELHDEIGSTAPPLEIWGKTKQGNLPNMKALSAKFTAYLKDDLKW